MERIKLILNWLYDQLIYPLVASVAASDYHYAAMLRKHPERR